MASMSAIAEQYFSTLNPLAQKIRADLDEAKAAYENIWDSLTEREKTEVINESLIKPDLSLKYTPLETLDFDISDPPFFRKCDPMSFFGREHGRRVVVDEQVTYRDEHSAPFLYQTRSQLDLCELSDKRYKEEEKVAAPVLSELALSHSKVVSELKSALRSHDAFKKKESPVEESAGFIAKIMSKKIKCRGEERERLVTPDPVVIVAAVGAEARTLSPRAAKSDWCDESSRLLASRECSEAPDDSAGEGVIRTGYDFLDNW